VINSTIVLWCGRRICSILDSELRCLSRLPNGAHAHMCGVRNSVHCTGRGSKSTKEVKTVGSHHPPADKVETGVFVVKRGVIRE
jgi:hypothetical protein